MLVKYFEISVALSLDLEGYRLDLPLSRRALIHFQELSQAICT